MKPDKPAAAVGDVLDQPTRARIVRDGGAELAPDGGDDKQGGQHHRDGFNYADIGRDIRADTVVKQHRGTKAR